VTERTLYNAARVYAQAVPRIRDPAPGWRPARLSAAACEEQAVELLRGALARVRADERAAFWREYVRADPSFGAIRQRPAMRALAAAQEDS
jgi:hypothetical protein